MGDLISRSALITEIEKHMVEVEYNYNRYESPISRGELMGFRGAVLKIKTAPTVEAEPVVHGEWIKLDMHRGMANHKCSVCKQECYVPTCMGEPMYCYCPDCGAKMGGK